MNDISVVIPAYQHASTLRVCLRALCTQTYPPKEILVVDDGSTDETNRVVMEFKKNVRYLFQSNQGACVARNTGASHTTGSLLLFCDADVLVHRDMLARMSEILEQHPESSYAYASFRWGWKRFPCQAFHEMALRKNNFIHTTSLMRRSAFPEFDPTIKRFQDWDLWLTMLEQGHRGIGIKDELFTVIEAPGRTGISTWIPSIVYRLPWNLLGWKPRQIAKYEEARAIIQAKHHL